MTLEIVSLFAGSFSIGLFVGIVLLMLFRWGRVRL